VKKDEHKNNKKFYASTEVSLVCKWQFKSRGPLLFLRIFLLRNAPGNHQLMAVDLMEDRTISHICNAYSIRQGRRLPPTFTITITRFVICNSNCNVKKEIKN
jgi:hypothetical protein